MPFHSIIVPTYNQDKYIGDALESILNQTDADWEVVVVNDGSTDETRNIVDAFVKKDSRIRCIHQENGGVARALNAALEEVTGEWIHWLSSDDLFEPNKLSVNRRWIAAHPQSNFFFSYFTLLREPSGLKERRELWGPVPAETQQIITLFYRNYISGISICARRTAWEAVGFFDPSLRYAQDYDQWLRFLQKNRATFIPEWTVISRNHSEQGSETFPAACYFDTAKAAIRFLNENTFPALVPFADLKSEEVVLRTIADTLEVASDRSAFIYSMGVHPALILRVLEWVYSDSCKWKTVRDLVQEHVREMAFQLEDDDWCWMWRHLALSMTGRQLHFSFQPVAPVAVALSEWQSRIGQEGTDARSLSEYLAKFEQVDVADVGVAATHQAKITLLTKEIGDPTSPIYAAASRLLALGHRPVVLTVGTAQGKPNWSHCGNVPVISLESFEMDNLPWLGDVDLAVYFDGIDRNPWLGSRASVQIDRALGAKKIVDGVVKALGCGEKSLRPVIFLERVLAGGGAERVVQDLTRHLDRTRYRCEIWTMFEEHSEVPNLGLTPHRKIVSVNTADNSSAVMQNVRGVVGIGQQIYHRAFNEKIRKKLAIGQHLHRIRKFNWRRHEVPRQIEIPPNVGGSSVELDFIPSVSHHQAQAKALGKAVKSLPTDAVVIAVMEEATVAAWMAQAQVTFPYIASLHTIESLCIEDIYKVPQRAQLERWFLKNACQQSNMVTVPSVGCKDDLIDVFNLDPTHIDVLPNPVDCSRIRRQSFRKLPAVDEWVRKSSGFRLVHVGRLDPQKNHELLFDACVELINDGRDFSLALVGDGWARPQLEKKVADLGLSNHITLVGEQENPAPWIAASDALALTSHFEAFGLVLVEAMICGTPVVSVDCPVGPRDVLGDERAGILIEASPQKLAHALSELMDSPALVQQLKKKGYERALAFDVKQIVPLWERLVDAQVK